MIWSIKGNFMTAMDVKNNLRGEDLIFAVARNLDFYPEIGICGKATHALLAVQGRFQDLACVVGSRNLDVGRLLPKPPATFDELRARRDGSIESLQALAEAAVYESQQALLESASAQVSYREIIGKYFVGVSSGDGWDAKSPRPELRKLDPEDVVESLFRLGGDRAESLERIFGGLEEEARNSDPDFKQIARLVVAGLKVCYDSVKIKKGTYWEHDIARRLGMGIESEYPPIWVEVKFPRFADNR